MTAYDAAVRVIIYGAGAVGSVIGGRLRQGGADVVLVARPAHVAAIRERGLTLRTAAGTEHVDVTAVTSIDELEATGDDIVVITAKTQDTPIIHSALVDWSSDVAVVCATNGVEHERMALRHFARVYAMVVQLPAQFEKPGEVTALFAPTNGILDVGCYPSGVDDVATELAALVEASPSLMSDVDDDVMTKKYGKLLLNLGNTADAACGFGGRRAGVVAAAIEEGKRVFAPRGSGGNNRPNDSSATRHVPRPCSWTSRPATRFSVVRHGKVSSRARRPSRPTTSTARSSCSRGCTARRRRPTSSCSSTPFACFAISRRPARSPRISSMRSGRPGARSQRNWRKQVRMSSTNSSGCSNAAKWPPFGCSDQ